MGSGVSSGQWWNERSRFAKPPAPVRVVEVVQQLRPLYYLKRARKADVLASRRNYFREKYTPAPDEFLGLHSVNFVNSIGDVAKMGNVTNRDVAGESDVLKARLAFLTWLRKNHPRVYADAVGASAQMGGIMDTISGALSKIDFGKISDGVAKAGTAYLAVKSQKDLLKLNLERAKTGLPPLDSTDYGIAPTVRTEIDVDPRLAAGLRDSMMMPLLFGGLALAAVLLLRR